MNKKATGQLAVCPHAGIPITSKKSHHSFGEQLIRLLLNSGNSVGSTILDHRTKHEQPYRLGTV